jgi:hypothetical protein
MGNNRGHVAMDVLKYAAVTPNLLKPGSAGQEAMLNP